MWAKTTPSTTTATSLANYQALKIPQMAGTLTRELLLYFEICQNVTNFLDDWFSFIYFESPKEQDSAEILPVTSLPCATDKVIEQRTKA